MKTRPAARCALGALFALATLPFAAPVRAAAAVVAPETHCASQASQRLLAIYLRYAQDILNGRKLNQLETYVAPSFRWHGAPSGMPDGVDPWRHLLTDVGIAFPDEHVKTRFALCADDLVLVQQELTGTNTGPLLGHAASGKAHRALHTEIYRIADGRIVELWGEGVIPLLLPQSGWQLVPPPPVRKAAP